MTTFVRGNTLTYKQRHSLRMKQTEPSILPNCIIMKIIRWATSEKRHGKKFGETNRIIKEIAKDFRGKGWHALAQDQVRDFHNNLGNPSPRFEIANSGQYILDVHTGFSPQAWSQHGLRGQPQNLQCIAYKRPHGRQIYGRGIYWSPNPLNPPDLSEADIIFERETPPAQFFSVYIGKSHKSNGKELILRKKFKRLDKIEEDLENGLINEGEYLRRINNL
jgi:hypothetical protein